LKSSKSSDSEDPDYNSGTNNADVMETRRKKTDYKPVKTHTREKRNQKQKPPKKQFEEKTG
jgi:hypothetical protein